MSMHGEIAFVNHATDQQVVAAVTVTVPGVVVWSLASVAAALGIRALLPHLPASSAGYHYVCPKHYVS